MQAFNRRQPVCAAIAGIVLMVKLLAFWKIYSRQVSVEQDGWRQKDAAEMRMEM